ncbi:MAG: heavy-metal-associated domain-containing protein [Clostridia bacterium]|jgi:copper chaperone CopZ|nr:heavy-metal-associated domain-containing protein [Clostridia bacterium]
MEEITLKVEGMMCRGCEKRIENAVANIEGVEKVVANHENRTVTIIKDQKVELKVIKEKIEDIGFEVKE